MHCTSSDPAYWSELQRQTLACYDEALLRQVAARLVKPRNQWPVEDLIERGGAATSNPVVIDRRLQDLTPPARRVLALIGHSRQPCWNLGNLVEMTIALGHSDGLQPVLELLEAGLLYPSLRGATERRDSNGASGKKIKSFEQWMAAPGPAGLLVFAPPPDRRSRHRRRLSACPISPRANEQAASATWRRHATAAKPARSRRRMGWSGCCAWRCCGSRWPPLRCGGRSKAASSSAISSASTGRLAERGAGGSTGGGARRGFPAIALAEQEGMVEEIEGELRAGGLPAAWDKGLAAALESLWADLPRLSDWNPLDGWRGGEAPAGNPFPSAYLLAFLLLARLPEEASVRPETIEAGSSRSIRTGRANRCGPRGSSRGWRRFSSAWRISCGWCRPYAAKTAPGACGCRRPGRWLLGLGEAPNLETVYTQTLLVQPNLQIIAYRQGLTSSLIARLTQFAAWENLGAACTLQLQPETVYRALEAGQTFDSIRLTLEQHGTRSRAAGRARFAAHLVEQARSHHGVSIGDAAGVRQRRGSQRSAGARLAGRSACRIAGRGRQRGRDRVPPFPPDRDARLRPAAGEMRSRRAGRRDAVGGPGTLGPAAGDGDAALRRAARRLGGERPTAVSADAGVAERGAVGRE